MVEHVSYTELEPETGSDYEEMVRKLIAFLHDQCDGLPGVEVRGGGSNLIHGKSGFDHQIDVSLRVPGVLFIVECKYWSKPVGVDAVLTLAARHRDIQAQESDVVVKASLVSTRSVTSGAELISEYFRVQLDQVNAFEEYALTFGSRHFVGLVSQLKLTDRTEATVIKGAPDEPEAGDQV